MKISRCRRGLTFSTVVIYDFYIEKVTIIQRLAISTSKICTEKTIFVIVVRIEQISVSASGNLKTKMMTLIS